MTKPIVLGSSSPYRAELLRRVCPTFEQVSPSIDETPAKNETPRELALRLTTEKAASIIGKLQGRAPCLVITSDQVASVKGQPIGKPGNRDRAIAQLQSFASQKVDFYTALQLTDSQSLHSEKCVERYSVFFRNLSIDQIEAYVDHDQPYDCAGSFKVEGRGIALFDKMEGDDPNSLVGLPLIKLCHFLRNFGYPI